MSAVTIATLVYKDPRWISFWHKSLREANNAADYRTLVVANDASQQVMESGCWDVDFRNDDPSEFYINRVYRAWNEAVLMARTQWVVLTNNDMAFSDGWLDSLIAAKQEMESVVPTSLLVENGRIPSAMPEYVKDFGTTPETYDAEGFKAYAETIRQHGCYEPGRLFMPALFDREDFLDLGGYTTNEGNKSGDRILFEKFIGLGFSWLTCLGSVVAHFQEGEQRG